MILTLNKYGKEPTVDQLEFERGLVIGSADADIPPLVRAEADGTPGLGRERGTLFWREGPSPAGGHRARE